MAEQLRREDWAQPENHQAHQIAASILNQGYPVDSVTQVTALAWNEAQRLKSHPVH